MITVGGRRDDSYFREGTYRQLIDLGGLGESVDFFHDAWRQGMSTKNGPE